MRKLTVSSKATFTRSSVFTHLGNGARSSSRQLDRLVFLHVPSYGNTAKNRNPPEEKGKKGGKKKEGGGASRSRSAANDFPRPFNREGGTHNDAARSVMNNDI